MHIRFLVLLRAPASAQVQYRQQVGYISSTDTGHVVQFRPANLIYRMPYLYECSRGWSAY